MGIPAPSAAAERGVAAASDFITESGRELWFVRWAEAARLPMVWLFVALAGVLVGISRLVAALDPSAAGLEARLPYNLSGVIAAVVTLGTWSLRRTQQDLDALRPLWLETPEAFAAVRAGLARLPQSVFVGTTLAGVLVGLTVQEAVFGRLTRLFAGDFGLAAAWLTSLAIGLWVLLLPGFFLALRNARVFGRVGARAIGVALYEVERGLPLARLGVRTLGLWIVLPVLLGAAAIAFDAAAPSILMWVVVLYAIGVVFCFVAPTAGLRGRIRREKRAEFERISRALAGEPHAMVGSVLGEEARPSDRLHLLQWRREVEGFREWPLDAPVLRRFALFVALPLLSWIAAALVERGLDVFLDR